MLQIDKSGTYNLCFIDLDIIFLAFICLCGTVPPGVSAVDEDDFDSDDEPECVGDDDNRGMELLLVSEVVAASPVPDNARAVALVDDLGGKAFGPVNDESLPSYSDWSPWISLFSSLASPMGKGGEVGGDMSE